MSSKKKPTSPPPSDEDTEVDMGAINKLLNKEIKDDIELTDADMEDPELLSMLSQIESGGSLPKPPSQSKKLEPVVKQQQKQQLPPQEVDDDDDELEKLMNEDDDLDLDELDDNPTPSKKSKTAIQVNNVQKQQQQPQPLPQQPQPQPQPQQVQSQINNVESIVRELEERKVIYTKNALLMTNSGQQQEGVRYIKSSRILDAAIEKLKRGDLNVSLKDMPPRVAIVQLDQGSKPTSAPTSTTTTPIKSTPTTSTTNTPKSVSPQAKLEILSRERIENEERQQIWELIEQDYMKQYHTLTTEALRLRDTDKIAAITLLKQSKSIRAILDQIEINKSHGIDPPPVRFEEKSNTREISFLHLKENELELTISQPEMEKVFGNTDVYIVGEFPYPDTPQKFQTPSFNCTKNTFTYTTKFTYDRKKSYERALDKKKLSLVFYSQRMIIMKSIIGKLEIKLGNLLTKCEINEKVPVLKEGSRRETGAFINLCLRVRHPLLKRDTITSIEKVLVLDSPIQVSSEVLSLSNKSTTSSGGSTTTTTVIQPVSKPTAKPQPQTTTTTTTTLTTSASKPQPQTTSTPTSASKPQPQTTTTTLTTSASKPQPQSQPQATPTTAVSKPQPQTQPVPKQPQPSEEDDEDEVDFDSLERIFSNNVLESMLESVKLQIQKQGAQPDFLEQKQAIEVKLQVLEVQVQSGLLTIEAYIKQVEGAIQSDKKLAVKLISKGEKDKAVKVAARIKMMKAELEESG